MTEMTLREILSDAIRFWEWARLLYNAVLALSVVGIFSRMMEPPQKQ